MADQHARTAVGQHFVQFARLVHRIDRDHDAPQFPGGKRCDDKLGNILQIDRDPVTGREPLLFQRAGQCIAGLVQLGHAQRRVEIADGRMRGELPHGAPEAVDDRRMAGLHAWWNLGVIQRQPGSGRIVKRHLRCSPQRNP